MTFKLLGGVSLALLLSSCAGTKTLYNDLTLKRSSVEYLHDSKKTLAAKTDTIHVLNPIVSDPAFSAAGQLKRKKAFVIPMIFFNYWESEHSFTVGKSIIEEDVSEVVKTSFINEFNRSTLLFADSASKSGLTLEIEVDSIGASGPYRSNGHILFILLAYSYSANESAGPGTAYSSMRYRLKNGSETILEGRSSKQLTTKPIKSGFDSPKDLRHFYGSNLTEAISMTLKSNIEEIVAHVQQYREKAITPQE